MTNLYTSSVGKIYVADKHGGIIQHNRFRLKHSLHEYTLMLPRAITNVHKDASVAAEIIGYCCWVEKNKIDELVNNLGIRLVVETYLQLTVKPSIESTYK